MTAMHYRAKVEENGTLSLPKEAQAELGLQPGDEVKISLIAVPHHGIARSIDDQHANSANGTTEYKKPLRGMGAFKGKLGGTAALFRDKQEEMRREERRR